MENKNLFQNLYLKQFNESNAIAYSKDFIANTSDYNFQLLDNAYRNAGKVYAQIKIAIETGKCQSEHCAMELAQLKQLEDAPKASLDFLASLMAELSVTEESTFDPNNNYKYSVANSLMNGKPGFSKTDGYEAYLNLLPDGSQQIVFMGPAVGSPLVINSSALNALNVSNTSLIASTPEISKDMLRLLTEVGLFAPDMVGENEELTPNAKISDEFALRSLDGAYDYEIIELENGKGRNMLQFDMDKIAKKITPFINAEVAGLMGSEQSVIAAWNVYISQDTSVEEDDQMAQNANAGADSWSYEKDLPLKQNKKDLFEKKYNEYFINNYLKQFITDQMPTVKEDAAVFDIEEAKKAKAQKFLKDNDLN